MNYYEVAPTAIIRIDNQTFTYESDETLSIGQIVEIPIGKKNYIGLVMAKTTRPDYPVRPITRTIEAKPLPAQLVETAQWMSQYYQTHLALVLQTILPSGITKKRRVSSVNVAKGLRNRTNFLFTDDQSRAIDEISNSPAKTILLHGITGSGKTLVYIESAKKALRNNQSVIILVPEIALTSQLIAEFSNYFDNILLTHSRQTEAERHIVWRQALNTTTPFVAIGPRSALFLPFDNIGLIVLDECHEPSYKQEQSPRYSALRVASFLAKKHRAKTILGSATPNIADYYLASRDEHQIVSMPHPARQDTISPSVELIDMTKRDNFSKHYFLSNQLLSALEKTFIDHSQALIFHNRRGTSSVTLCKNCGWQAGCPRCYIPLTLHADKHILRCHICGLSAPVPTSCPACQHADIIHKGIGTKRIEEELKKLFPNQKIARFDGDIEAIQGVDQRYEELYRGDIDIIIGTQVIAKGLDLPYLRTVGVIQADAGLSLPDYTSPERTFQLLSQVVGRVGRSHHPTKVIVQSFQPNHPSIVDGISQNYQNFYKRAIEQRRRTNFPPFCYLLKLTCSYKTERSAVKNSQALASTIKENCPASVEIIGPTPAFYERLRDNYRWQIIIKSSRRQDLLDILRFQPKTHWQSELDPTSLL